MPVSAFKSAHGAAAAQELELGMELTPKRTTMKHASMDLTTMALTHITMELTTMELCTELATKH
jgi:hypothetical protein